MAADPLIDSLTRAVEQAPDDVALRAHLASLLVERGRCAEAITQCGTGLGIAPGDPALLAVLTEATAKMSGAPVPPSSPAAPPSPPAVPDRAPVVPPAGSRTPPGPSSNPDGFDWAAAEEQVDAVPVEAFVEAPVPPMDENDVDVVLAPALRMADVGGMEQVKRRLDLTLFGPLRNPEMAKAFGTSARGGMLLYGPPGCGKSFLATAIAGELGARFYRVEIADILSKWMGEAEQALQAIFDTARRNAPCVMFFDELDALGHKRSQVGPYMRSTVNQLLLEMDSGTGENDGVYILGATNHPWDVDDALRRPGRFDKMVLVTPPDEAARESILAHHLKDRPVVGVDLARLAKKTDGHTGADLAYLCTTATQYAMQASVQTGRVMPITRREIDAALAQIRPSAGSWFETAETVLQFAGTDGDFDELAEYMRRRPRRRR
ncbi:MAG: AAA family ATPase [Gordonia sp. (in: high G+C Gram-positive bacteria)]|uniref:ATP-binding protein n=1 Tax=Gordonia sp. (in: high G+C Gram-positive bacteria) TaxID=84139 RepID=UPI0039E58BD7